MTARTIAQLYQRNKREAAQSLKTARHLTFCAQVDNVIKNGLMATDNRPLPERIHSLLLSNRPGAASELPPPVKLEAPVKPLYDLLIATKKYGVGSRTRDAENAPIVWIKFAGEDKRPPKDATITIAHPSVQKFLLGYELVTTECHQFELIRKYRKITPGSTPA